MGRSLDWYDELWLIGYASQLSVPNEYPFAYPPLAPSEVATMAAFMNSGRGVFATGDHADFGSYLCADVPRVSSMREWLSNPSSTDGNRLSTLQPPPSAGTNPVIPFDYQSDDIPQPVNTGVSPHPLVMLADGPLNRLPDHMHEGEVKLSAQPNQVFKMPINGSELQVSGEPFIEYTGLELPQIVATGSVIQHSESNTETEYHGKLTDGEYQVSGLKCFGLIGAYDGQRVGVGRVATQSTFHHFLDINLLGDPQAPKTQPNGEPNPPAFGFTNSTWLDHFKAYFRNLAFWLAPSTAHAHSLLGVLSTLSASAGVRGLLSGARSPSAEDAVGEAALQTLDRFGVPRWWMAAMLFAGAEVDRSLPALRGDLSLEGSGDIGFLLRPTLGACLLEFASQPSLRGQEDAAATARRNAIRSALERSLDQKHQELSDGVLKHSELSDSIRAAFGVRNLASAVA